MALTIEDKLEIHELYTRYNHAIDSGDGPAWAATFTPDGVLETSIGSPSGTKELIEFCDTLNANYRPRHWVNNLLLEETPTGVTGRCYLMGLLLGEQPGISNTAIYEDEIVRTPSGWRFARRVVNND
ncbi:MAG: nuclear transport factor 2 family protein [Dehalococcoidia bacterium]|nr:nuclear transport factor 2 family protein [Dehalococcoidia bacterium]MCA9843125.1 nuclear transport factor 2 family protein [Dehalococcoidia bacterium]MCA9853299.1 nuclear transport factor 2 family protein [Dehalococcoidia bacterium]